ncbi:S-layer homology domain-containing protein [Lysinibacillus sp. BW-2-10]|uniref:S-layer homology domain-containing protein n=1 Tax=Lysinibacillus sp. BW-2-10 TaxID=2590030 RepID=UPI00117CB187|nr:S-layer homology domain-containing protein [Lysinibacillus sp. BW-2-10]TSI07361.1 S-layer homology domain-containing protein [Lysinibacillus sp. BW-2-10]
MLNNKKRLSKSILVAALALGFTTSSIVVPLPSETAEAVTNKVTFKDVPVSHWGYNDVILAAEKKLIVGYNGNFNPKGQVTRAEFAQMLAQAFDGAERVQNTFTDVSKSHWATDAINEGIALGFIDPAEYKNNQFQPKKPMTRTEIAKWLSKGLVSINAEYAEIMEAMANATTPFLPISDLKQVKASDIPYIGIVMGTELMIGNSKDTFNPNASITRVEVAAILNRYLEKMHKDPSEFSKLGEFRNINDSGDFTIIDIE